MYSYLCKILGCSTFCATTAINYCVLTPISVWYQSSNAWYLAVDDQIDKQLDVCQYILIFSTGQSPWQRHSCTLNHCRMERRHWCQNYGTSPQYQLSENKHKLADKKQIPLSQQCPSISSSLLVGGLAVVVNNVVCRINKVILHWARLALGWVTISRGYTTSVCM